MKACGLFILICGQICVTLAAAGPIPKDIVELAKSHEGTTIWLRPLASMSHKAYFSVDHRDFIFEYDKSRLFSVHTPVLASITKVDTDDHRIRFHLRNESLGKSKITLYAEDDSAMVAAAIWSFFRRAFSETEQSASLADFIGNSSSRTLHVAGCNHLPETANAVHFSSRDEARSAGYRECAVCFLSRPQVSGYDDEMTLGKLVAAELRRHSPPSHSDSLNELIDSVGRRVLSRWPIPLKGYNYHFQVVEGDESNAIACPGGQIYLTTGLLASIEEEGELEGVLAHEISHVEMRHGYRQYRTSKRASVIGGIAAAVVGATATSRTKDPTGAVLIYEAIQVFSRIAITIALTGYSRSYEEEADAFAVAYLDQFGSVLGPAPYLNTLRKLQYYANVNEIPEDVESLLQTHPDIGNRIRKTRGTETRLFESRNTYDAINDDSNLVATVELQMQSFVDVLPLERSSQKEGTSYDPYWRPRQKPKRMRELRLYASIETTPYLGKTEAITSLTVKCRGRSFRLDNKEDTSVLPDDLVGAVFVSPDLTGFLPDTIDEIQLILGGRTFTCRSPAQ